MAGGVPMMSRREMFGAGMLGTLAGGANETQDLGDKILKEGFDGLNENVEAVKTSIDQGTRGNSMNFGGVGAVKTEIQRWMKTSGRFPEYCDIGVAIFFDIYDWHVRNQQQIQISRNTEQRLVIQFMLTQLVLRWENAENYVGIPYDR
jgi:hypothetical protein